MDDAQNPATQSELQKATEWWGKKYAENPRDLDAALSYARNLKAMGEKRRALSVLQQASILHGEDKRLAGEYGRLALEFDQVGLASRLLAAADDPTRPDWRVISARGTVLAKQGKYGDAIPYFERALSLSHDQPSVLSNLALAHAMNGEPAKAEGLLRQAAASDGTSQKIRQNLALVLGLQGKYDEAKLLASQDIAPQVATENAEYLRRVVQLEPKRIPAPQPATQIATARQQYEATAPTETAALPSRPAHAAPAKQRHAVKPAAKAAAAAWAPQVALSETAKR
jgi:Flp pilus assembly protein TadD